MLTDLPLVGAWVRVRTNTTPGSPTFLGLVVEHRGLQPRAVVFNLSGGMLALPAEIVEVLTPEQVAQLDCPPATEVQAAYAAGRVQR